MHPEALQFINKLNLAQHPEGGYFKEIYRSDESIKGEVLPGRYNKKDHSYSTSIYFLLEGVQVSRFHRLKSDEIWLYHSGSRAIIYIISEDGTLTRRNIGKDTLSGDEFQVVIKKNSWFSAEVEDKMSYILVGCSVSPGFEFTDFELADKAMLLREFPIHQELIRKFT